MENNNLKKDIIKHLIAIGVLLLLAFAYCSPILEGKVTAQYDVIQARGAQGEINKYYEETGQRTLWTNSMFGGMPAYQIRAIYPSNLIKYCINVATLGIPIPVYYIFWYLLGFYFLLTSFRLNQWLSVFGAIAFAFSSYNILLLEAGHLGKAHAIAHMATILTGVFLCFRGKYFLGAAIISLFSAFQLTANHIQISYYLMISLLVLFIVKLIYAIHEKQMQSFVKAMTAICIAAILAIGPSISQLWSTYEYSKDTIRGDKSELSINPKDNTKDGLDKEYALRWSYGVKETFTLLIPNFLGGSSSEFFVQDKESKSLKELRKINDPKQANQLARYTQKYWGDQPFTSGPVYFGASICFLFVLGLFLISGPIKWWILIATLLSIMLSWGRHFQWFTDIFFDYFPMYNKFRAVSMALVIAQLTFPLLAFLTLKEIFDKKIEKQKLIKALKQSLIITGGLCLFFILFSSSLFDFKTTIDYQLQEKGANSLVNALVADRTALFKLDAFRSLIFILLSAGILWGFISKKLRTKYAMIAIGILILVDLWSLDKRYFNNDDFVSKQSYDQQIQPNQADLIIMADKDPNYRVLNLTTNTFNDAKTSYFHKSIGGYHAAKLRRYQELIEHQIGKNNMSVLNMLNTKYFIVSNQKGGKPIPQRNPNTLGNVWFVNKYKIVENADEEMDALSDFNPAQTAIVDKRFQKYLDDLKIIPDSSASIKLLDYKPDYLTYETNANKEQLAVFSEIYYNDQKGWNAYIDGEYVPHIRVNYVLRSMRIPAGKHKVEYKFEPKSYYVGEKIALIVSILLLGGFILIVYREVKKRYSNNTAN